MGPFRAVLVTAILALVGLLVVFQQVRANEIKYEIVRRQAETKRLALENRALLLQVSEARRPEALERRAKALRINLQELGHDSVVRASKPRTDGVARGPKKPRP